MIRNFAGEIPITQGKIDVALSQLARAYRNNSYVAEILFPRVEVQNQSDKYWLYGREAQQLLEKTLRAPAAAAEKIAQTISTDNYFCPDHALARFISDEERGNFQAGDVEQWAVQTIMDKLLLDEEIAAALLATTLGTYPSTNRVTLSGGTQWSSTGTPVDDIQAGHLQVMQCGQRANMLILGPQVLAKLKTNAQIVARVAPTQTGPVTTENLKAIFEVDQVVVPTAIQLDAALAATFVWGKHAILAHVEPAPSMQDISFGKTFVWRGAPGTVGGFQTLIGRLDPPSRKSDEVSAHYYYGQKITSNISAYFIQNAVA